MFLTTRAAPSSASIPTSGASSRSTTGRRPSSCSGSSRRRGQAGSGAGGGGPKTSPWFLAEIEEVTALLGEDRDRYGVEANRRVTRALRDALFAQEIIARPLDAALAFREFEQALPGRVPSSHPPTP